MLGNASESSFRLVGQAAQGGFETAKSFVTKDQKLRDKGVDELKVAGLQVYDGLKYAVKTAASSTMDTGVGLATKDYDRVYNGVKSLSQMVIVATVSITAFDLLTPADVANATEIQAINAGYEGDVHPVSGVPFDRAEIHYNDQIISEVFPVFPETFTAQISEAHYLNNDQMHFQEANAQFAAAIQSNFALASELGLSDMDLGNLQQGVTPQGYTWHHHEQPGQLQLVDSELHGQTAHTGGRFIWGGGSLSR